MAEIDCFILFNNAEPFMMSIDKEVNYQTFDEEIKKRLSKNTGEELLYSYNPSNESFIQNDKDLADAFAYAESFGGDYLFVINTSEKPKNIEREESEEEEENELEELEELENLIPENPKDSSFSVPITVQKDENVKEKVEVKKESDKKDGTVDFFEFLKNQISEQIPMLSPILESINFENIVNNVNNINENNENNEKTENKNGQEAKEADFIHQLFQHLSPQLFNNSEAPQAFPFPMPFPFPPAPSSCAKPRSENVPKNPPFPSFSPFVPSSQSANPLQFLSLADILNASLNKHSKVEKKENKPNQQVHLASCDHCSKQIIGIRYKCLTCPNFDLCEKCEVNSPQTHNHVFAKIRNADNQTMFGFAAPPPHVPQYRPMPPRRVPQPPQAHFPRAYPHPHAHPHTHPHTYPHFRPSNVHPLHNPTEPSVKPSCIRISPRNIESKSPFVHPFMHVRPQPAPENNKITKLEEQIASLESSIASIKLSLAKQKEDKPKPRTHPMLRNLQYYRSTDPYSDSDSDSDEDDSDEDQVFEIKVNRRF